MHLDPFLRKRDAILGCLLGGAVGDAIGLPFEGLTRARVARRIGAGPLGHSLIGAFSGYKSGHALNNLLLRRLMADAESWELVSFSGDQPAPISYTHPVSAT